MTWVQEKSSLCSSLRWKKDNIDLFFFLSSIWSSSQMHFISNPANQKDFFFNPKRPQFFFKDHFFLLFWVLPPGGPSKVDKVLKFSQLLWGPGNQKPEIPLRAWQGTPSGLNLNCYLYALGGLRLKYLPFSVTEYIRTSQILKTSQNLSNWLNVDA